MADYNVSFVDAISTGYLTAASLVRGAAKRAFMSEMLIGINGTMSDEVADWRIRRITTDGGTSSAVTPNPVDGADGVAITAGAENYTIESTITADSELLEATIHRRATYRWVAQPGKELVIPDTAGGGLAFEILAPSAAGNVLGSLGFSE